MSEPLDLEKLGFKCGLEIHQRVDTHKLFCDCYANPSAGGEAKKEHALQRRLRAVVGELGVVDRAAAFEAQKGFLFNYESEHDTSCLVEMDDEPPREMNKQALEVAVSVSRALLCKFVDEVHVMRKTVVDGSAVSGFQRTACIASNGAIGSSEGPVSIQTVCIEEEASGIIERAAQGTTYRLDRLGIPLVEIATDPVLKDGKHAAEVAEKIGLLLRATGRVQRGIGTIRQDLNVSIAGGTRVEIKGAQDLSQLPKIVEHEALRQKRLLDLRDTLNRRNVKKQQLDILDVSSLTKNSKSPLLQKGFAQGKVLLGAKLAGFTTVLKMEIMPEHRFGTELADYARASAGVGGLIHSDEDLEEKYKIEQDIAASLFRGLGVTSTDAFILVIDTPVKAEKALRSAFARAMQALEGVPVETRKAEGDKSRFLRPMPGAQRMYPETDVPPIALTREFIESINPPKSPEEIVKELRKEGLNEQLTQKLASSPHLLAFQELRQKTKADATIVATTLLETLRNLSREGIDQDELVDNGTVEAALVLFAQGKITRAAISELLKNAKNGKQVAKTAEEKGLLKMSLDKLRDVALEELKLAQGNVGRAFGEIMRKHRLVVEAEDARAVLERLA
ncbi:MAG TPA: Glu-tRNA(Gln) amidotransferase subunit GatE [Candidatus Norongarragalinales archaeon]|jgi:glutamyl-tRNA(Gln) amidotransferase subunit E|nr:Glu-tRNA(Gln) amidotransferase subunit GatE [Candidatus Norongarragalinales archaeon]